MRCEVFLPCVVHRAPCVHFLTFVFLLSSSTIASAKVDYLLSYLYIFLILLLLNIFLFLFFWIRLIVSYYDSFKILMQPVSWL